MAKRRILYILALLGCLIFYMAYQKWFSWILLLTVVLFPWFSLALSLRAMMHLRLYPSGANRIPLGTAQTIGLKSTSADPPPPFRSKLLVTRPITGERWILRPGDPLPTGHCGGLTANPYKPRVYDYLGLFRIKAQRNETRTFYVMPQPVKMEIPPDLTRFLSRSWKPKAGGGYAENHEMRPYRPGDNLNQIHWKLSAKVDDLMLREPMEPERGLMLLTMDISGTPSELDHKYGRLLWLGNWLLEQHISFEIRVLTGSGIECRTISDEWDLRKCIDSLLCAPYAAEDTIRDRTFSAAWQYHIGGEPNET